MRILGVDPGGTTGVCVFTDEHIGVGVGREEGGLQYGNSELGWLLYYDEVVYLGANWRESERLTVWALMGLVEQFQVDVVACEDFILRDPSKGSGWSAKRVSLSPVRIAAQLDILIEAMNSATDETRLVEGTGWQQVGRQVAVVWQQASMAKSVMTDERLRSANLWLPGKQHARDAVRHAVLAYKQLRDKGARVTPTKKARGTPKA